MSEAPLNLPRVSVITPSYNQARFIERTIRSVLMQDYPNVEYWVVDGGSTDGTKEILERSGDSVHWVSEHDNGQTAAINKGFALASGEILAWLNSDDTFLAGAIATSVEALQSSGAAMSYGRCLVIDEHDNCLREYDLRPREREDVFLRLLNSDPSFIPQPTVFFTREAATAIGPLNESLQMCMDYDYWLRLSRQFPVVFIPQQLGTIRCHPGTKTSNFQHRSLQELRRVRSLYRPNVLSTFYIRQAYRYLKWLLRGGL